MIILSIILVIIMCYGIYFLGRNDRVCKLRIDLCNYDYEVNMEKVSDGTYSSVTASRIYDSLPSHERMLFSLKPIKFESWISNEMSAKIKERLSK